MIKKRVWQALCGFNLLQIIKNSRSAFRLN